MGTLGNWRNVSGFFSNRKTIAHVDEKETVEWLGSHEQALQTLVEELKTSQALGPVHPSDTVIVKWGFAEHGTYCNMFQKSPHGPKQPLSSTALKNTDKRYTDWGKGL